MSKDVKAPLHSGAVRSVGIFWSVVFLAVGIVAIREALVSFDSISGSLWIAPAAQAIDGLQRADWLLGVAVGAGVIGLVLLYLALKPRRRVGIALSSASAVYLTPSAAASIALASARRVDGVLGASARTSNSKLDLAAKTTSKDDELKTSIKSAVNSRLSALETKPNIKVRLRQQKVGL